MRVKESLNNAGWKFNKNESGVPQKFPKEWESVTLPHTWNALDGEDGGSDYFRGRCVYAVKIERERDENEIYLEIEAASLKAEVYVNEAFAGEHKGGYSRFRVNITDFLNKCENLACICVDNSEDESIYPQSADFTFFGGLYRGVNLISVPRTHFDLDYFGSGGLFCTPKREGTDAIFEIEARITNPKENCTVKFAVADKEGRRLKEAELPAKEIVKCGLEIENAHLWQGVEDAYLYTITAELCENGKTLDEIEERAGVREFEVDPQKGFILNGKATPLRGVARHQDREGMGYAITAKEHREDAELIREVGANTVRLAHYQHDSFFCDLCDEIGFVVWAEIPLISAMSGKNTAHENCKSQLRELVYQNYNHPSICFWGIANEITIRGESEKMYENLAELNELAHDLDKSRLTTMAQFTAYPKDGKLNFLTDVLSYNHYFGWYMGKFEDNEKWIDEFHEQHPERAIGLSEYGCEGIIRYHSDKPRRKDYSEEYQALYHEHMAKVISERNWLWATHVRNMFDFAADSRDEGGVKGRNKKGLVTMDRKTKKDAFYLYKAYWSSEPFVHICGKRYSKRTGDFADIKIYSNQNEVKLFKDGELVGEKRGEKVFEFCNIPIERGKTRLSCKCGRCDRQCGA